MKKGMSWVSVSLAVMAVGAVTAWAKPLSLDQVVLFNSGVGYFQCESQVNGTETGELVFRSDQINDVIKSLVFMDDGKGSVSAVTYETREPLERLLATFRMDLSDNPDRAALLNRLRGVEIRYRTSGDDGEGRILGVEKQKVRQDDLTYTKATLNLLDDGGMRSLPLDDVLEIEFVDEAIRADFSAALESLAGALDQDKKTVRLTFKGEGERNVKVGYLLETPVWKTSYRLVWENDKLYLQGWAYIENTTDEDWDAIRLSLVSGRPISFIQNLYDPIYVQRPEVRMQTEAVTLPQEQRMRAKRMPAAPMKAMQAEPDFDGFFGDDFAEMEAAPASAGGGFAYSVAEESGTQREAGELFEYVINSPVTLPRRQASMLPILDAEVPGEKISFYERSVNERHPLNGLRFDNTAGQFLMAGPVTVFDGGIYAGDASLPATPDGGEQDLVYAIDLGCDVTVEEGRLPERVVKIRIVKGSLLIDQLQEEVTDYRIKNKEPEERTLLIRHPARHNWAIVEPDGVEATADDEYELDVAVPPLTNIVFSVREQQVISRTMALSNMGSRQVELFLQQPDLTDDMKQALQHFSALRNELERHREAIEQMTRKLNEIVKDQDRIRKNMQTVARNSQSYARWERKLGRQEDEIEQLNGDIAKEREAAEKAQRKLDEYLGNLTL